MNILVLTQRCPFPPNKGEKIRSYNHIKFLADRGHNITLVSPYEEDSELGYFDELKNNHCQQVLHQKLSHKALRLAKGLVFGKAMSVANFYHASLQSKVNHALKSGQFDAILCSASSMAEYIFNSETLANLSNKPQLVMDFMDLDSDKWKQYAQKSRLLMKLIYLRESKKIAQLEKKTAKTFDSCIFITEAEVALFHQANPGFNNIYAIENGTDTSVFFPPNKPRSAKNPILLFAGVMDYAPNIDAVIWFVENVWQAILEKWPQAQFCIAGMNPTEKIKQLEKYKGIEVTGFIEDIKPCFDNANIFVAPFRIARGVQNKVLQAFASGLPVIATPMGAEGIRYCEGKDILLACNANEFLIELAKLCDNPVTYQQLSENALHTITNHYSWKHILNPLEKLLLNNAENPTKSIEANRIKTNESLC